jgi:tetratricopeptide (TPR) repeat protein
LSYRIAAHHGLGLALHALGRVEEGKVHIAEAEQLLVNPTAYVRGWLSYTRANLARAEGDTVLAEALYLENLAVADRFSPFDAALTTLALLALLVEQGRHQEAAEAGRRLHALLHPLRFHQNAQEALLQLARLGHGMTLDKIAYAEQTVAAARRAGTPQAAISL